LITIGESQHLKRLNHYKYASQAKARQKVYNQLRLAAKTETKDFNDQITWISKVVLLEDDKHIRRAKESLLTLPLGLLFDRPGRISPSLFVSDSCTYGCAGGGSGTPGSEGHAKQVEGGKRAGLLTSSIHSKDPSERTEKEKASIDPFLQVAARKASIFAKDEVERTDEEQALVDAWLKLGTKGSAKETDLAKKKLQQLSVTLDLSEETSQLKIEEARRDLEIKYSEQRIRSEKIKLGRTKDKSKPSRKVKCSKCGLIWETGLTYTKGRPGAAPQVTHSFLGTEEHQLNCSLRGLRRSVGPNLSLTFADEVVASP
jgi:hypothetical protein